MRKLTLTLTAAMLMLGTMAMTASAQTQAPVVAAPVVAWNFHAPLTYSKPNVKEVDCNGTELVPVVVRPGWAGGCPGG